VNDSDITLLRHCHYGRLLNVIVFTAISRSRSSSPVRPGNIVIDTPPRPVGKTRRTFNAEEVATLEHLMVTDPVRLATADNIKFVISMPPFAGHNRTVSSIRTKVTELRRHRQFK